MAQKRNVQKLVLQAVALAGVVTVALVAPNVIGAMAKTGMIPRKRQKEVIMNAQKRMVRRGLLAVRGGKVTLTPKGQRELQRFQLYDYRIPRQRIWDGKWRILIFDVPESRRGQRVKLRQTLSSVGFARLQDSVWLYPFPCGEFLLLLKTDFRLGKDLLFLTVERMEHDRPWRTYFNIHQK